MGTLPEAVLVLSIPLTACQSHCLPILGVRCHLYGLLPQPRHYESNIWIYVHYGKFGKCRKLKLIHPDPTTKIITVNVLVYFCPVFFLCIYNLFYYKTGIILYLQICILLSSLIYCEHFPMSINILQKVMATWYSIIWIVVDTASCLPSISPPC